MSNGSQGAKGAGGKPPASVFLDEYGTCMLGSECQCLPVPGRPGAKMPWLGTKCAQWRPLGARSHEDLMAHARRLWEARKKERHERQDHQLPRPL